MMLTTTAKGTIIIFSLLFLFLFLGSIEENEFQITAEPHDQRWPALYDNIVVWMDSRNGDWDIYGYNLTTRNEFPIATETGDQMYPAIYKDIVVWLDTRNDRKDLYGYNLSTHEEFEIPDESEVRGDPAIYENIVVWEGRTRSGVHIHGYDLSTSEVFQISAGPKSERNPAVYKTIVVWQDRRGDRDTIYGYDLLTSREFQAGAKGYLHQDNDQSNPALYNNIVVWTEGYDENIYGYNLLTSERITIAAARMGSCEMYTDFPTSSKEPALYNDTVVWVDCRNGNEDIYGYTLSTGQEFQITVNEHTQQSPALFNDIVVWEDNRNGNWDIYGYTLFPPLQITPSSRTRLLFLDFLYTLVVVVPVVFVVVIGGKTVWDVHTFTSAPEEVLRSQAEKDFKRDNFFLVLPAVSVIFFGLIGFLFIHSGWVYGSLYLSTSALWIIYIFWNKKIPCIRVTREEILIFHYLVKPERIKWSSIERVDFYKTKNKVELTLPDKKKVIDLSSIEEEGRIDMIIVLRKSPCGTPFFFAEER